VLLLNSTYEPLTALPIRRAVVMVLCGKADVVHDDPAGPVIHSATRAIAVPSVIRIALPPSRSAPTRSGSPPKAARSVAGSGTPSESMSRIRPWRCQSAAGLRSTTCAS
jgi:hypothetical protein